MKVYQQLRHLEEFQENPFLENLKIPVTPRMNSFIGRGSRDKAIVNIATGEVDDDLLVTGTKKYIDGEQFVKIFVKEMEVIFDLSKASQKVFSFMITKVGYDDKILFDMEECLGKTGYKSKTQVFRSLSELCVKGFIAKTKHQFVYWINPKLFYKGDRLVVLREYRKAKKNKLDESQLDLFQGQIEGVKALEKRINP